MMSFVNRHFMNVWRHWYSEKKKTGNDVDSQNTDIVFNDRIIAELFFYPSKDDFISWDIYQHILVRCGTDKCLTPIFNIWDALCQPNKIMEDCQAVWNRNPDKSESEKWNLYEGVQNKNNEETYPSRVAFYALLRFYANSTDDYDQLSNWMRVAWNIIENSTIDGSSYHSALHLIDKLSEHSKDIYTFLSDTNSRIESDFAKEQVLEEIAKAKQILKNDCKDCHRNGDGRTWEDAIMEAESHAFFKGAIRFLFTDGKGDEKWRDFDTKWANAQEYFDENGVKDEYRNKALMLRSFISKYSKWGEFLGVNYDNEPQTWKILLTSRWNSAHDVLLNGVCSEEELNSFNGSLAVFDNGYEELQNAVLRELVSSSILVEAAEWNSRLNWRYNAYSLYPYNTKAEWKIYVIGNHRNSILATLCDKNKITIIDDRNRRFKSGDCNNFFWGWDIKFRYNDNDCIFQWNADGNVYLIENDNVKTFAIDSIKIDNEYDFEEKLKTFQMSSSQEQCSNI